jgi:hypothetical protein
MKNLHVGLRAIPAFRPACGNCKQAGRKIPHPGRQQAKSARQGSADFAFRVRAKFARDSY